MSVPHSNSEKGKDSLYPNLPPYPSEEPPLYAPTNPLNIDPDRSQIEAELREIENEIITLRTVLASKLERAAVLKRQLGLYDLTVARDDMKRAVHSIAESKPYTTVKGVVTKQWNNVTKTNAYKSVNSSVSNFFRSVKSSVSGTSNNGPASVQGREQPSAPPYHSKSP